MTQLTLTIPAQDAPLHGVRIRPREVRAWLEDLPFMDLGRCARLAHEQLRLMNRQRINAAARLEILGDFLATYRRLESALPAPANGNADLHAQLRRLLQDLSFGYKIVTHELVNGRGGFLEARSLPMALLGAVHTLGMQLLARYAHYQRAPRALWSECIALYAYAWQNGRETYAAPLPGAGEQSIDRSFRLIAQLHLADPYHLPPGMATTLYRYFAQHPDLSTIHAEPPQASTCIQLKEAFTRAPGERAPHLYLELDALLAQMHGDLETLERHAQPQAIGLPPDTPTLPLSYTLAETLDHWRHHPTRIAEREQTHARVDVVCGLDAAWCMINGGHSFDPAMFVSAAEENNIDVSAPASAPPPRRPTPEVFNCTGINRSSGGLALRYSGGLRPHPRVGQLIALSRPQQRIASRWVLAVCRWLVESENGDGFELGVEYLIREPRAVVIRAMTQSLSRRDYQPAIAALQRRAGENVHILLAGEGLEAGGRFILLESGKQQAAVCSEKLDSGSGYQRLIFRPTEPG